MYNQFNSIMEAEKRNKNHKLGNIRQVIQLQELN